VDGGGVGPKYVVPFMCFPSHPKITTRISILLSLKTKTIAKIKC